MSRHRGAKHRRRYELLGGISLLSPEYLLSVERWPFHTEPPDHLVLLSYLLDLSVSQSSTLMPMHYQHDFRPCLAYLRTPPLRFGRRPPQSNCPLSTVRRPVSRVGVRTQAQQGWCFSVDSESSGELSSQSPSYPTHAGPKPNIILQ